MAMELWENMEWFCDECDASLDDQPGFTGERGIWTCSKCGCDNYISPVVIETIGDDDFDIEDP